MHKRLFNVTFVFILLMFFSISSPLLAQTESGRSKAQKEALKEQMINSGKSEAEIKEQLKRSGMSDAEIQSHLESLQKSDQLITRSDQDLFESITDTADTADVAKEEFDELSQFDEFDDIEEEIPILREAPIAEGELRPFGYEIFNLSPKTFEPLEGGPVDPNYPLGPGDEIVLTLWGDTEQFHRLRIDREGKILIPDIGQVVISGLTLERAEEKIKSRLSGVYSGLDPLSGSQSTFFDLSMGKLRSIRIFIMGEVKRPGGYTMRATVTAFNALYYGGGPNQRGSLRNIRIIRDGKTINRMDLYSYLLYGKTEEDMRLQDGDAIFVPIRGRMVAIKGEINAPAFYELKPWDKLRNLLSLARGLKATAYVDRIQIDRIVPFEERESYPQERKIIDIDYKSYMKDKDKDFQLVDGDVISVFSILDFKMNLVNIAGSVTRPGTYELNEEMRLTDLIEEADGVLGEIYLDRADIIRTKSDLTKQLIQIDLGLAMSGDSTQNLLLQELDEVKIFSIHEIEGSYSVTIRGQVKNPGRYPLLEDMNLYDLLFKAGGMLDPAYMKNTYLERADIIRIGDNSLKRDLITFNLGKLLDGDQNENIDLQNQDEIFIYSMTDIEGQPSVRVSGHVKRPGRYRFQDNMTIYDLLFKAGGMLDEDFRKETYLERADLLRLNDDGITRKTIPIHIGHVLLRDPKEDIHLIDNDELIVYDIFTVERKKFVTITGRVKRPGQIELTDGMSLKDLLMRAGGYTNDAFRLHAEVARIDPFNLGEKSLADIIKVDLPKTLSGARPGDQGFLLKEYDRITVMRHPNWQLQRTVTISGEVNFPGEYSLKDKDEKLSDLIKRAGGMSSEAFEEGARFTRGGQRVIFDLNKALKSNSAKDDIVLRPGDSITIPKNPMVVSLSGALQTPGLLKYTPGKKSMYYIDRVGGFVKDADRRSVLITRANGRVDVGIKRFWWDPKVNEGDQIRVALKEKKEPFDMSVFLKETASIAASFATVIFVISQSAK
ncbi:hypothetical protein E3V36_05730 [Candidatus Marinimicrobia bacterium MT.SAG.2]|nr:hypothetical protein E3V36_05730 [Candidatus Marinimicrobia bacterium MT.SAG.2]